MPELGEGYSGFVELEFRHGVDEQERSIDVLEQVSDSGGFSDVEVDPPSSSVQAPGSVNRPLVDNRTPKTSHPS